MQYGHIALGSGVVALTAGATMLVVGFDGIEHIYGVGIVLTLVGTMVLGWARLARVFRSVTRPADDAYELGYQIGYDKGFLEGHRSARPVVVPMASASTCLQCDDRNRKEGLAGGTDVYPQTAVG